MIYLRDDVIQMSERNTFLLSLGSTLSIALFGIVGAFYIELLKSPPERNAYALAFDLLGMIVLGYFSVYCFMSVNRNLEENE